MFAARAFSHLLVRVSDLTSTEKFMSSIERGVATRLVHINSELVRGESSSLETKAAIEEHCFEWYAPGISEPLSETFANEIMLSAIERTSEMLKVNLFP